MAADTHPGFRPGAAGSAVERLRAYSILVYVLYLLGLPTVGTTMLIGVIVAYLKKHDARETVFESHFANAIDVFWLTLVVGLVAILFWPLFLLGAAIHAVLIVWLYYRSISGLLRAIEWQPYS